MIRFLCTDLDRTLIPNGPAEEPEDARRHLSDYLNRHGIRLAYVSGRDPGRVQDAIERWELPVPDFVAADAGTTILHLEHGVWKPDEEWAARQLACWGGRDGSSVHACLRGVDPLLAQSSDRQHPFKRSYTVSKGTHLPSLQRLIEQRTQAEGLSVAMLFSHDPMSDEILLDLVSPVATKRGAMAHLATTLSLDICEVLFAGDSGNDLDALSSEFPAVLVGNADTPTRIQARHSVSSGPYADRLHEARGSYAAGILEGLEHFATL